MGTYSNIVAVFSGDDNLAAAISSNSTSLTVTARRGLRRLLTELYRGHALAGAL